MHVCIFEDANYHQLNPLVHFRAVYELRFGISSLYEKILALLPASKISFHARNYLAPLLVRRYPTYEVNTISSDKCLFINGRLLVDKTLAKEILKLAKSDFVILSHNNIVAACLSGEKLASVKEKLGKGVLSNADFEGIHQEEIEAEFVEFPWNLIYRNPEQLQKDLERVKRKQSGTVHRTSVLIQRKDIIIEKGATVAPYCVLDARNGAIYIGKTATLMPHTVVIGPAMIGESSLLKSGTQIYGGTSIGSMCKIGGEVEGTIFHGYSNKQHAGFVGHSYVGPWVNLGAGTNTSDLKNNYSTVTVSFGDTKIDTGLQFLGLIIGDHSKSSINTMFNTGSIVGVNCNVLGGAFPPKYIPSFAWQNLDGTFEEYDLAKSLDVARTVMARRNAELTSEEENIFRFIFEQTRKERVLFGVKGSK